MKGLQAQDNPAPTGDLPCRIPKSSSEFPSFPSFLSFFFLFCSSSPFPLWKSSSYSSLKAQQHFRRKNIILSSTWGENFYGLLCWQEVKVFVIIKVIEILTVLRTDFKIQEHTNGRDGQQKLHSLYPVCNISLNYRGRKVDLALRMFSNSREGRQWQIQMSNINKTIQRNTLDILLECYSLLAGLYSV